MSKSTQQNQNTFFNLHTSGIGYLNNINEVKVKKGQTFLSCNITALTGESSAPEYRFFNVNVVGEQNEKLIKRCIKAVKENKKILIAFTIGDLWADSFVYDEDSKYHRKGDIGVMLKGRLIRIKSISIDGNKVYQEEPKEKQQYAAPAQKSAPQYQSKPTGDADFATTPPQYQERRQSARVGRQAQKPAPVQYPDNSF